ncbi:Glucan 1,4-alpha-maltotetraohydrolase [Rhizoctonia solani]|uniref:Glucan 1,4-alpha-maltotetraohydrolase n=1 Tax=Rhizoctonia solani TaxID=456999 RepID=A0A0K6G0B8_9AGAM|nr:Glucan 1,4-alpha-maltotetraohydrolase [Rhizoctonia solani]
MMHPLVLLALGLSASVSGSPLHVTRADPCAAIHNTTWLKPSQVHSCLSYFPFNATLRDNVVDVLSAMLDQFHASTKFHLDMPEPFKDTTVDILGELQRIKKSTYSSDFELHQDVSRTVNRLADGHAGYTNYCYDNLFITLLPFPLVTLAQPGNENIQNIYIVPEASKIALQFGIEGDALEVWRSKLGRNLSDFDGARIVSIDGKAPWDVVDAHAAVAGNYQAKTTRQNGFFYSHSLQSFQLGDFAQSPLPIRGDSISLTLVRNGTNSEETYDVPYLSTRGANALNFTNAQDLWAKNCRATNETNGRSYSEFARAKGKTGTGAELTYPVRFQRDPIIPQTHRVHRIAVSNSVKDNSEFDATFMERLFPAGNVSGTGDMNWFVLKDGKTAVLRLGSFQGNLTALQQNVLDGIDAVKSAGASKLLIDVTNNGGGFVCLASWLHRVLAGPEPGLDFQPGMNSSVRAQQLPKKIVETIVGLNLTEFPGFLYNPSSWKDIKNKTFPSNYNWLTPSVEVQANAVTDEFSQKMGDDCLPFQLIPPRTRPFEFENIAIMSNGRCGSSCSLFSILMHVRYQVKTVVVGGKPGTTQQYCGIVGGQSSNYVNITSEVKTYGLANDPLAPPDFLTNSEQGIVFRLAYSPSDPSTFEEFRSHPAQYTFPLLPSTVNDLKALWEDIAVRLWPA